MVGRAVIVVLLAGAALGMKAPRIASAVAPAGDSPNLIRDKGFEQPLAGAAFVTREAGETIGPWQVTTGSVDQIGHYWVGARNGGQSVDLNGFSLGAIAQDVATKPGSAYRIALWYAGNPEGGPRIKGLEVVWNGMVVKSLETDTARRTKTAMGWRKAHITVVATSSVSRLILKSMVSAGAYGPAVDEVTVQQAFPTPLSVTPARLAPGSGPVTVTMDGRGLGPGASVTVEPASGISFNVALFTPNRIRLSMTVAADVPPGVRDVVVTNVDGRSRTCARCLVIGT
jgi:choice-of-anchor C domain-containing protein